MLVDSSTSFLFLALHELLYPDNIEDGLADHNASTCPECVLQKSSVTPSSSTGSRDGSPASDSKSKIFTAKLSLFSSTLKAKSAEMKGKFIDYINNPIASGGAVERHVQSSDKNKSKPYRNLLPVFMIDDESGGEEDRDSPSGKNLVMDQHYFCFPN